MMKQRLAIVKWAMEHGIKPASERFGLPVLFGGAETFVDIARFGEKKVGLLRRFRPFRDGTPSDDHLGDIFATLDAEEFQRCFVAWVAALTGASADVIAAPGDDGHTRRRTRSAANSASRPVVCA